MTLLPEGANLLLLLTASLALISTLSQTTFTC